MKNLMLVFGIFTAILFFASCEQDSLLEEFDEMNNDLTTTTTADSLNPEVTIETATIEQTDSIAIEQIDGPLESRSSLIYDGTASVGTGGWYLLYFSKYNLNDGYRYRAIVTPTHGDPDLYIHGRDGNGSYRTIRKSTYTGYYSENTYGTKCDLTHYEDRLYFSVYGKTHATFRIKIYREYVGNRACGNNGCTFRTVRSENFETYQPWRKIGPQSYNWTTWDYGREGGSQDAYVNAQGYNNYLKIKQDRIEDVVYRLGNQTHGKYELSFQMRMTGAGYFNIQSSESSRAGGGVMSAYFLNNGSYYLKTNGGGQTAQYYYPKHTWLTVKITADFNSNRYSMTINGRDFNITTAQNFYAFGGINFYAIDYANFDVDNIVLKKCS